MPIYTYTCILISTKNDSLFFVKKLIAVHSPAQPDNTGIYTLVETDKNHGLYEIITMI